ncbi:MAG: hypothetical protein V1859_02385 [archaeon]
MKILVFYNNGKKVLYTIRLFTEEIRQRFNDELRNGLIKDYEIVG